MTPRGIYGRRVLAVTIVAVAMSAGPLLSGCASSGPQAATLMSNLGCPGARDDDPGPSMLQSSGCTLEDGASIEIATFSSKPVETKWVAEWCHRFIRSAGCVEGPLWVATYNSLPARAQADRRHILSVLGGQLVATTGSSVGL
jgi:hypothetical protein